VILPASAPVAITTHGALVTDVVARLRDAGCVFAEDEARILGEAATSDAHLEAMVRRRAAGDPLEHIVGWSEFAGLRIAVGPGVFVPRRRTELLAAEAAARCRPGSVVVELCCGAGAVAAVLAAAVADLELYAADIDPAAVGYARRNLGAARAVLVGDLFDALPVSLRGRLDVVVANAPYVPTDAIAMMPPEARDHEPLVALDGGSDGLDIHRRIAVATPDWLAPGGCLLIETGEGQAPIATALFAGCGLAARVVRSDELAATVVIGTRQQQGSRQHAVP
jgi:release factor glutamine methyltransferase